MITRTFDAAFLNTVANNPDVRPYVGSGVGPLDLTALISNPANVTLETEHGGWVLINLMPGTYELHTLFLPAGRGAGYFAAAHEALRYVFTQTDALEILTRCPDDNPGARMAAVKVGFRERFRREGVWQSGNGEACGVSYQALTADDWFKRDTLIEDAGRYVIGEIGGMEEDALLARLIGSAVMMARGGHAAKAVGFFNRAAAFAGYGSIVALREDLFDIGGTLVLVKPEGVGVLPTL